MAESSDAPGLARFRAKRAEWIEWLQGEDPNSILNQIYDMIRRAAVFRVINRARYLAPPLDNGGVALCGLVHEFIDRCFIDSQFNAIRRLLDRHPADGKKSVYSLYRLVADMETHASLFTRENILAAQGIEYDYARLRKAWQEEERKLIESGATSWCVPPEYDWGPSEDRHKHLDRLTRVSQSDRTRNDVVRPEVLAALKDGLKELDEIRTYADKNIAHAASRESREAYNADQIRMTLGHIWRAHEVICRITNVLSRFILTGTHHIFLPLFEPRWIEYVDRPFVDPKDTNQLVETWGAYWEEISSWVDWPPSADGATPED